MPGKAQAVSGRLPQDKTRFGSGSTFHISRIMLLLSIVTISHYHLRHYRLWSWQGPWRLWQFEAKCAFARPGPGSAESPYERGPGTSRISHPTFAKKQ